MGEDDSPKLSCNRKGDRWKHKEKGEEKGHPVVAFGQAVGGCSGVKHGGVRSNGMGLPDLKVGGRGL